MTQTPINQPNLIPQDQDIEQQQDLISTVPSGQVLQHPQPEHQLSHPEQHQIVETSAPAPIQSQDQLYEVGYRLALSELGYKGMHSKIFADAFVGEYQRALENGLSPALAIRFGAEFAGPFALAFMHYLSVNQQREEEHDIYGGARAFAEMSFDVYEESFAKDFAPIHEENMIAQNLQQNISKALKTEVTPDNLEDALKVQYALIFKKGHQDGKQEGHEIGREEGIEEGMLKGKEIGFEEGFKQGRQEGYQKGDSDGFQRGLDQGREEGLKKGFERGHEKGVEEGFRNGHKEGKIVGIEEGKKFGRQEGHTKGYAEAFMELTGSAPEGMASK